MNAPHHDRRQGIFPHWFMQWAICGLIGIVMFLADRRITALEQRITDLEKQWNDFHLQYVQDRSSLLQGQSQVLRDLRTMCGQKNLNVPCPEQR